MPLCFLVASRIAPDLDKSYGLVRQFRFSGSCRIRGPNGPPARRFQEKQPRRGGQGGGAHFYVDFGRQSWKKVPDLHQRVAHLQQDWQQMSPPDLTTHLNRSQPTAFGSRAGRTSDPERRTPRIANWPLSSEVIQTDVLQTGSAEQVAGARSSASVGGVTAMRSKCVWPATPSNQQPNR